MYGAALFEYVATLIARGMPMEYFIEGGRSRTGRLLKPRLGMLSMTIRAYIKYRKRPVAFIPVYIGYEKMIESKSYLAELSGEDKKSETFLGSVWSIINLRGQYGKVTANFGKPVYLDDVLDAHSNVWRLIPFQPDSRPQWLQETVSSVSTRIMQGINKNVSVNGTNLVATILLCTPRLTMDEKELVEMILLYTRIIRSSDYSSHITHSELDPVHQIRNLEAMKLLKRRNHELGDIIHLDSKQSTALTYYRNNVLHLFAMPSLVACCFLNMRSQTREQVINLIKITYPFIKAELFIHWRIAELDDVISATLDNLSEQGLLMKNAQLDLYTRPGSGAQEYTQLYMLARIISPVLEVYYMTLALLTMNETDIVPREQLETKSVLLAQRVSMMNESNAPDYFDRKLIANFVDQLLKLGFLDEHGANGLMLSDAFHMADNSARLLLSRNTRTNILQMVKLIVSQDEDKS